MPDSGTPLTIRRADAVGATLLGAWVSDEPVAWVDASRLTDELASRNYRAEWSWIAEQDGRPVGRALWWGSASAARPATLDCLLASDSVARAEDVGAALIRAGLESFGPGSALEFNVDVEPDWMGDSAAIEAVRWRHAAARAGGFTRTTERVSYARTDADRRPNRSTRLRFTAASDGAFRDLFAQVAAGSLDARTLDMVARGGVDALANDDLAFYLSLPGERAAWRVAELPDGTTIGFIIPTRTAYDASISYLGVLPEPRGQGYVHDLLAEMVHVHHDDAQARIVGTTDAANTPMRQAFDRAGFTVTRVRIVHEQSGTVVSSHDPLCASPHRDPLLDTGAGTVGPRGRRRNRFLYRDGGRSVRPEYGHAYVRERSRASDGERDLTTASRTSDPLFTVGVGVQGRRHGGRKARTGFRQFHVQGSSGGAPGQERCEWYWTA